jgi:tRNA (guanine-N7-)-methyltransferase
MMDVHELRLNLTSDLKVQNPYTLALNNEFRDYAFSEVRAPLNKGKWRDEVLRMSTSVPLDLEVGTGNGTYFQHHALHNPGRGLVGLEIKYKPLIQTIRRTLKAGAKNACVARYHAFNLEHLFEEGELSDVFVHFPDPWVSPRKPKNRFVQKRNLDILWKLQRPGSKIQFKTDSREYFDWALPEIKSSNYEIEFLTYDLHQSEMANSNFITAFEKIFIRQNIPINYVRLVKNA